MKWVTPMTEIGASKAGPPAPSDTVRPRSAWPAGAACVCFFALTAVLLQAYGILHWKIIHRNYPALQDPIKADLFRLLGYLEIYHLTAVLSVAFGVWTFWGSPRWIRWACLLFGALSLLMFIIVM